MYNASRRLILVAACVLSGTAQADANVKCHLKFAMSGWSAFYQQAEGSGTITCSNGAKRTVKLEMKGGGLTFGKSTISDGRGEFSAVHGIDDVMGTYASAEAHAGAVKSAKAQVVTKGEVSLALSGKGEGWDLGIGFGKFIIEPK
jgi:hypothetical protein